MREKAEIEGIKCHLSRGKGFFFCFLCPFPFLGRPPGPFHSPETRQGFQPLPDCRTAGLPDCRTAGLPDCRTAGLPDCRTAGLPDCQQSTVNSQQSTVNSQQPTVNRQLTTVSVGRADSAATVGGRRD